MGASGLSSTDFQTEETSEISATRILEESDLLLSENDQELLPVDINHLMKCYELYLRNSGKHPRDVFLELSGVLDLVKNVFSAYSVLKCNSYNPCEMENLDLSTIIDRIFKEQEKISALGDSSVFLYGRSYSFPNKVEAKEKSERYWIFKEAIQLGAKRFLFDRRFYDRSSLVDSSVSEPSAAKEPTELEWDELSQLKELVVLDSSLSLSDCSRDEFLKELKSGLATAALYNAPSIGVLWSRGSNNEVANVYFLNYLASCNRCGRGVSYKDNLKAALSNEAHESLEYVIKYSGYNIEEFLSLSFKEIRDLIPTDYQTDAAYLFLNELVLTEYEVCSYDLDHAVEADMQSDFLILALLSRITKTLMPCAYFLEIDSSLQSNNFNSVVSILLDRLARDENSVFLYDSNLLHPYPKVPKIIEQSVDSSLDESVLTSLYSYLGMNEWILPFFLSSKEARIGGFSLKKLDQLACSSCLGRGVVLHSNILGKVFYKDCLLCHKIGLTSDLYNTSAFGLSLEEFFSLGLFSFFEWFSRIPKESYSKENNKRKEIVKNLIDILQEKQILVSIGDIHLNTLLSDLSPQQLVIIKFFKNLFDLGNMDELMSILKSI